MLIELTDIRRYPVKSCRGERLGEAIVEPWGLAGDRRWMIVDDAGDQVTARDCPPLILITPTTVDGGIRLASPGLPDLMVPQPPAVRDVPGGGPVPVSVFGTSLDAMAAGAEAAQWLSKITGEPARLVYLDDPTQRATNPKYSKAGDVVSFADGYPLLLASEASLGALNDQIAAGPHAAQGPVPMTRFRPNVVVSGAPAWAEDSWRRVRIGAVTFRVAKGCDRCVLTTIDPETAAKGHEPLATLARHRRWDGKVWFAVNLIPDSPAGGGRIRVGDPVEVIA